MAGTGLDEQQLRHNQALMQNIHQYDDDSASPDGHVRNAEESVRTLVSRLEYGHIQARQSKPRIIESRCIEKHTESARNPQQQEQSPLMTSATTTAAATTSEELARLKPVADLIAQVTVNQHIASFASPALVAAHNKIPAPAAATTAKLGRNRNVDLAISLSANLNAAKENLKGTSQTTVAALSVAGALPSHKQVVNNKPAHQQIIYERCDKSTTTSTTVAASEMSGGGGIVVDVIANKRPNGIKDTVDNSSGHAGQDADNATTMSTSQRLVKWNTLSKFDEKNYVTNDAKLKQKPKYDEIEFEEFEVFDPNNPHTNSECYDSLNDK